MKKERLILFDWGHVIQDGNSKKCSIEEARKKVCEDMRPVYYNELLGMFDLDEFWTLNGKKFESFIINKLKETKSDKNFTDFRNSYLTHNKNVPYFKNTIQLINDLFGKNCYIGLLSNISELDVIQLNEHLNLNKFDYLFLSSFLGVQKPNDKIYSIVLNETNILPNNILFIDDKEVNIKVAKEHGWHTCLATGEEIDKIKKEILKFYNLYKLK